MYAARNLPAGKSLPESRGPGMPGPYRCAEFN